MVIDVNEIHVIFLPCVITDNISLSRQIEIWFFVRENLRYGKIFGYQTKGGKVYLMIYAMHVNQTYGKHIFIVRQVNAKVHAYPKDSFSATI